MSETVQQPLKLFYCYAHEDQALRDTLDSHLSSLKRQQLIEVWYDRKISVGTMWEHEIDKQLDTADIILLLVSAAFLASDYCYGKEMTQAIRRHEEGTARVIPIILRPVDWEGTPFHKLQVLPTSAKPVTRWINPDDAYEAIAKSLRVVIKELQGSQAVSPSPKPTESKSVVHPKVDWSTAPHVEKFLGREKELSELRHWTVDQRCRVIAILGIGGIGKTALAATLSEQIKQEFDYIFWRSLQNAPPLETFLEKCILFLSDQKQINLPKGEDEQISLLIEYLRKQKCLLILDNVETIIQAEKHVQQYRNQYEAYGRLFRHVGETQHQSCLLLTSREKPPEIALYEGKTNPVRSLLLAGLEQTEGKKILEDQGLFGPEEAWTALILLYSGNPLALKIVSEPIRELFKGDIATFLQTGETIVGNIHNLLSTQFNRLAPIEQHLMYWLAIEREAVSLETLQSDMVQRVLKREILGALESLRRRSMIEMSGVALFTLQPAVMEYITEEFIRRLSDEFLHESPTLMTDHFLIKAQAKDYIRESQTRLILKPIVENFLYALGRAETEKRFVRLLDSLRNGTPQKSGYAASNIVNILIQMGWEPSGYNFSSLTVRQAYLQGASMRNVDFSYADLSKSVFNGAFENILSIALHPDGTRLAAGTMNGDVWIWQVPDGTPLITLRGHKDLVSSVTFSPNGKLLASGADDQVVRLWDVNTGQCTHVLQGHTNRIMSVTFSPDSKLLASGGDDQVVRLWDVNTGQCIHVLQGHTHRVRSVAFSADGKLLASGSSDKLIYLWDMNTCQNSAVLLGHTDGLRSVTFSSDSRLLASGSDDQTIRLWDTHTGQCTNTLLGHTDQIWSVAFSQDSKLLASGSDDHTIRLWNVSMGVCTHVLQGHTNRVRTVTFSTDDSLLASGSEDQNIRFWNVNTGDCLKSLQGYIDGIWSVAFSSDDHFLACSGAAQLIHIWDAHTGRFLRSLHGHGSWVWYIAFSPDSKLLASGGDDAYIRLWDVNSGLNTGILGGHTSWVWSVAFSPDSKLLASGSDDHTVCIWEIHTAQCVHTLREHTNRVRTVVFSPNGKLLASGGDDHTVCLWDVETAKCITSLQGHQSWVWCVCFSHDGKLLASASHDQTVRIWDVDTGKCINVLHGHTDWVWSVAFSPDDKQLASSSLDQTIRQWNPQTGECIRTLRGHLRRVSSIAFSSDGTTLASGSADGTVRLWDGQTGEYLKTLRGDRPYEHMNITGVKGVTPAQKSTLKALGAFEH